MRADDTTRAYPDPDLATEVGGGRFILTPRGRLIQAARRRDPADLYRQRTALVYQGLDMSISDLVDAHYQIDLLTNSGGLTDDV